jgi:hypothetical protein
VKLISLILLLVALRLAELIMEKLRFLQDLMGK